MTVIYSQNYRNQEYNEFSDTQSLIHIAENMGVLYTDKEKELLTLDFNNTVCLNSKVFIDIDIIQNDITMTGNSDSGREAKVTY